MHLSLNTNDAAVLEKSPNWDKYKDSVGFIEEGFPFREGFPEGAYGSPHKSYLLIFRDGTRVAGRPDYSRTYYSEGTRWDFLDDYGRVSRTGFRQYVIVAWCEIDQSQPK